MSHESICFVNDSPQEAHIKLTIYFADREPIRDITLTVGAERCVHQRLDQVQSPKGEKIPLDTPYGLKVESDVNVVVQHTRLDATQPSLALFTTMAYPLETE